MTYTYHASRASGYPNLPGWKGRNATTKATSREAALDVAPIAKTQSAKILQAIKDAGPTGRSSDQVSAVTGINRYAVRSRTSELLAAGKIEITDTRTKNETGRTAVIWRAVI